MKTKKMDYLPLVDGIKDDATRQFAEDLVTILQKDRQDLYDDLQVLFGALGSTLSFMQSNVAANQSAVALNVLGLAGNTEFTMPKDGHITKVSIASNDARTAGTCTVDVTVNGTVQGVQAILNASNTTYHYNTYEREDKTFTAGQRIGVKITTSADWAPVTADIVVIVFVEF